MREREREREREKEVQIPDNLYPEKPFELGDAQPGIKIGSTAIYRLYIKYRQCIAGIVAFERHSIRNDKVALEEGRRRPSEIAGACSSVFLE
ncbi:hypothetical protein HZH66_012039 [Vespula vulgaris]|uniref:Uncharacterized protein n=1 Tax=Vespula vulgaris TaxID=7454 RepID=A0A834JB55_VESVU|nr:hypothetical protein HZH66_012039 [Vespula vulgaris]